MGNDIKGSDATLSRSGWTINDAKSGIWWDLYLSCGRRGVLEAANMN